MCVHGVSKMVSPEFSVLMDTGQLLVSSEPLIFRQSIPLDLLSAKSAQSHIQPTER